MKRIYRNLYIGGFLILIQGFIFCSCSSPSSRQRIEAARSSAHHLAAADAMDSFWLDYRSPEDRDVRKWEFYYKHCTLGRDRIFYGRAEYMCTDPY